MIHFIPAAAIMIAAGAIGMPVSGFITVQAGFAGKGIISGITWALLWLSLAALLLGIAIQAGAWLQGS